MGTGEPLQPDPASKVPSMCPWKVRRLGWGISQGLGTNWRLTGLTKPSWTKNEWTLHGFQANYLWVVNVLLKFFLLYVLWNYPLAEGPPTKMADVAFREFRMASSGHNPDPGTPLRTTAAVEHKHFQVHNPDALLKGHGSEDTRYEIPSKSWHLSNPVIPIIMVIAFGGGPYRFLVLCAIIAFAGNPSALKCFVYISDTSASVILQWSSTMLIVTHTNIDKTKEEGTNVRQKFVLSNCQEFNKI